MLLVAPAGRGEQELRRHFDPTISWAGPRDQGISPVQSLNADKTILSLLHPYACHLPTV